LPRNTRTDSITRSREVPSPAKKSLEIPLSIC
jgi:hypothetical protein